MTSNLAASWVRDHSVGIPELDHQHEQILDLLAAAKQSAQDKSGELPPLLAGLRQVVMFHFTFEELALRNSAGLSKHLQDHADFLAAIDSVDKANPEPALSLLENWLHRHIRDFDQKGLASG